MRTIIGRKAVSLLSALSSLVTFSCAGSYAQQLSKNKLQVVGWEECGAITTWPSIQGHPIQVDLPRKTYSFGGVEIDGGEKNNVLITPLSGVFQFTYTAATPTPQIYGKDFLMEVAVIYQMPNGDFNEARFVPAGLSLGSPYNIVVSQQSWPQLLGFGNFLDLAFIYLYKPQTNHAINEEVEGRFTEIAPYNNNKGLGLNPPVVFEYGCSN